MEKPVGAVGSGERTRTQATQVWESHLPHPTCATQPL